MTQDEITSLRELAEKVMFFKKNNLSSKETYEFAEKLTPKKVIEFLDTIDRLQRQNEIMKEALGNICIGLLGRSSDTANDWVNNAKVYAEKTLKNCESINPDPEAP